MVKRIKHLDAVNDVSLAYHGVLSVLLSGNGKGIRKKGLVFKRILNQNTARASILS